jgi:hypothetical protein
MRYYINNFTDGTLRYEMNATREYNHSAAINARLLDIFTLHYLS